MGQTLGNIRGDVVIFLAFCICDNRDASAIHSTAGNGTTPHITRREIAGQGDGITSKSRTCNRRSCGRDGDDDGQARSPSQTRPRGVERPYMAGCRTGVDGGVGRCPKLLSHTLLCISSRSLASLSRRANPPSSSSSSSPSASPSSLAPAPPSQRPPGMSCTRAGDGPSSTCSWPARIFGVRMLTRAGGDGASRHLEGKDGARDPGEKAVESSTRRGAESSHLGVEEAWGEMLRGL